MARFHNLTRLKYEKAQLKNRYDSLRKDWRAWYNLFGRETGLGWDPENPLYEKFRNKGLPFANDLTTLFKDKAGDSEDASVGATTEFANIGLNSSQKTDGQKSGEKRKRAIRANKPSKKKASASSKLAEAVSLIAETCRSRNDVVGNASIGEVMVELYTMDEISNDLYLHAQCCNLLMFKPAREIFISLRGSEEKRLNWLKHTIDNPLSFMTM
ncbi:L10-interacting MYB domain-containing protein-like [Medicago truncatula]|uniref:L10-interacting MYB domain-containing protein-like n=1 Tax=Medicago truncatula TaxID=3880 RepID=UPI001968112E|nr:L10-interacting MYB domain-containing protein-like [Medicago truncatula]